MSSCSARDKIRSNEVNMKERDGDARLSEADEECLSRPEQISRREGHRIGLCGMQRACMNPVLGTRGLGGSGRFSHREQPLQPTKARFGPSMSSLCEIADLPPEGWRVAVQRAASRSNAGASPRNFDRQFAPIFGNFRGLRRETPRARTVWRGKRHSNPQ